MVEIRRSPDIDPNMGGVVNPDINSELQESIREQADAVLEQYKDVVDIIEFEKLPMKGRRGERKLEEEERDYFNASLVNCIQECERVARLAVGLGADNIIVLDQSARPYGILFHNVLKMVKLEYAKIKEISPDQVKMPEIKFVNPSDPPKDISAESWFSIDEKNSSLLKNIVKPSTRNLVFDESSEAIPGVGITSKSNRDDIVGDMSINEQYQLKDGDTKVITPDGPYTNARYASPRMFRASEIISKTTNSILYPVVGLSTLAGGNFETLYEDLYGKRYVRPTKDNKSKSIHGWVSEVNKDIGGEEIERIYDLARTVSAFVIRDIYEKSFSKKENKI